MKMFTKRAILSAAAVAAMAVMGTSAVMADLNKREHYRCWDNTLRVSHGGWVSYRHMAQANCDAARRSYPNNQMWVETERY